MKKNHHLHRQIHLCLIILLFPGVFGQKLVTSVGICRSKGKCEKYQD